MTTNDKLTIEEVEQFAKFSDYDRVRQVASQLADTMRENESIKGAALALLLQSVPDGDKHTRLQNRHVKMLADAIRSKESDNG